MTSDIIQSLWIGDRLSVMERLCIESFLHQGHQFHLYLYAPCDGVPAGATIKDGREILPADQIFRYQGGYGEGSPSAFSNLFRYAMLFERGGWWVDLDLIALKPFQFGTEHVLGLVRGGKGGSRVAAGAIRVPPGSELIGRCLEVARAAEKHSVRWGQIGPRLLRRMAHELGMEASMQPPPVFYDIDAADFWRLIRPRQTIPDGVAVHLWAQLWRHYGLNPDGRYPETSIYEQLIARYLPDARTEARPRVNVTAAILRSLPRRVSTGMWFWSTRLRRRLRRA
ncbi:MAG TPA: hypothetical protein VIQ98_09405 [Gemmatimonadales bacterium]|jgi:Glycosyltransferase sugar-binding region containing DXD motif.